MKPLSARIRKRRAPQRQQSDSHQTIPIPRRQSSRLEAKLHSTSILHSLGTKCGPQTLFEQLPTDPKTSHPVRDILHTHLPTSGPSEVSAPVPSRKQLQEDSCLQTNKHQTRKRRSIEGGAERPLKRARLTEKNLEAFDKIGGRQRKSAGKKSTGQPSTTTTTDKDFGAKLQQNNIVYTTLDARAPDDVDSIRELLDRPRESELPELLDYQRYLAVTEDFENELSVEISAYPLLAKRRSRKVEIRGYLQRPNHAWSAVDNNLTTGLSDPQPDLVESYRKTDYPLQAVKALSADLAPSSYNEAMPAYAVEFKSSHGDMKEAKLQCAYDGSIMTEGARGAHTYMGKSNEDFYGKTQALTVAFNGGLIEYYGHHALQTPGPLQLVADGAAPNEDAARDIVKHHSYLLDYDNPRASLRNFQSAYKHTRNAQDIGYKWATERKDALWAYTNGEYTQTSLDASISAQQPPNNCDPYDDEVDPTNQLLGKSKTSSTANNQAFFMRNGYASPTYNPTAPPQLSEDLSVPLKSQQLSAPTSAPKEDIEYARGHKKTRARTRHAVAVEGLREVADKRKSRKTQK